MVSLPPLNPKSPSHVDASAVDKKTPGGPPEAVQLMLRCWAVMIAGELIHQILSVVFAFVDPSALRDAAKQQAKQRGEEISDGLINMGVYGSLILMTLIQLGVLLLFVFALRAVRNKSSQAGNAYRLLQIFGVFFALRMITLFMMQPASTAIPVVLYGIDGVVQIILGVAGILGIIYSTDKDAVNWVAPKKDGSKKDAAKTEKEQ
ncbi:hypothetical protein HMPREF3145_02605 [Corynebacterium sp. HMSC05C01]|uniref:hypothetical protein n=1 Tax=Corynebacterium sp. HMSC05C01 TaxID=1581113 RepID=UPI0008A22481|nr:hypothetical protein [Corynebacterium sp. HMSC05C01]OFT71800.1 hypothetical protein HMPREF3145_02605 [Corynebacterium sp. HMSC05C01]